MGEVGGLSLPVNTAGPAVPVIETAKAPLDHTMSQRSLSDPTGFCCGPS